MSDNEPSDDEMSGDETSDDEPDNEEASDNEEKSDYEEESDFEEASDNEPSDTELSDDKTSGDERDANVVQKKSRKLRHALTFELKDGSLFMIDQDDYHKCRTIVRRCIYPDLEAISTIQEWCEIDNKPPYRVISIELLGLTTEEETTSGRDVIVPVFHRFVCKLDGLVKLQVPDLGCYIGALRRLPREIGLLKNLKLLDLKECKGMDYLPPSIGSLSSLVELVLPKSAQLKVLPSEIGRLSNLERLHHASNYLLHLPSEIGQLKSLRHLNLNFSQKLVLFQSEGACYPRRESIW